ncbi:MAG TPA: DUF308 domain-containing protein [Blastocatellia bacterium]|nr:DUF308 domain-containing protein [Blastocatellia bacterium]
MLNLMTQNWWAIALRGLVAVLFGIAAFMWPGITLWVLVALFGAYALFNGIFTVIEAFSRGVSRERWRPLLFEGVIGSAIGVVTLIIGPWLTAMGLLYLIAFWAIMTGVFEIITAIRLRHEIGGEWLLALIAILSMAFGLLLVSFPAPGALSVILIIGAFAFATGALMIALAFKLRSLRLPGSSTG